MRLYRLALAKYSDTAFSGEGSRLVGGRWTPPGFVAVYTASSIALSVLETLVHVDSSVMPRHLVIPVDAPEDVEITRITPVDLAANWRSIPAPAELQSIGRAWLEDGETALLQIPSVVIPQEFNVVLNPHHPDFARLIFGEAEDFSLDYRLL